jgi:hypothetical protein
VCVCQNSKASSGRKQKGVHGETRTCIELQKEDEEESSCNDHAQGDAEPRYSDIRIHLVFDGLENDRQIGRSPEEKRACV